MYMNVSFSEKKSFKVELFLNLKSITIDMLCPFGPLCSSPQDTHRPFSHRAFSVGRFLVAWSECTALDRITSFSACKKVRHNRL